MNKLTTAMKLSLCALALGTVAAQGAQFFRISGPVKTTITDQRHLHRPNGSVASQPNQLG
jgi:hypothetical protein